MAQVSADAAARLIAAPEALDLLADPAPPPALRRREAFFRRSLAAADMLAAAIAIALVAAREGVTPHLATALALPAVVLLAKIIGLYDRDELVLSKRSLDEAPRLFGVATLFALLGWLLGPELLPRSLSRQAGLELWSGMFVALVLARTIARGIARDRCSDERVLLVGSSTAALHLQEKLARTPGVRATLVGWVSFVPEPALERPGMPPAGSLEDLPRRVAELAVERVVVAPEEGTDDHVLEHIRMVKALGVRVSILPRLFEVVGSSVAFDDVGGLTLLGLRQLGLSRSSRFVKRSFDVVGAGLGLLLGAPLLAVAALLIKLDSPGPVLFGQPRVGRDGRIFCMWKLRTMRMGADAEKPALAPVNEGADGFFKIADDPRITRVGRRLRRTSLDELTQLVNVVRGEMSLVGPRPLIEEEDLRVEGWYRRRLHLTPGMTGPWQILGSSRIPLAEMVVLDYLYVANWTLWNDAKILLRTVSRVFGARGL